MVERRRPTRPGCWPAQAVANHALAGEAVLDTSTASTAVPLFDFTGWDESPRRPRSARASTSSRGSCRPDGSAGGSPSARRARRRPRARVGLHRRVRRAAGGRRRPRRRRPRDLRHHAHHLGGHHQRDAGARLLDHPAHRGREAARRAARATRAGCSATGRRACSRTAGGAAPSPVGSRCGRRTRGASGRRSTTRSAAACSPISISRTTRRRCAARRTRRRGSSRAVCSTPRASTPGSRRAGSSRRAAASWSTSGCRPSPTRPRCRSTASRVPEGGALGSAWLARIAAGLEEPMAMTEGRRWAGVGRTRRARPRVARTGGRALRAVPRAVSDHLDRRRGLP